MLIVWAQCFWHLFDEYPQYNSSNLCVCVCQRGERGRDIKGVFLQIIEDTSGIMSSL